MIPAALDATLDELDVIGLSFERLTPRNPSEGEPGWYAKLIVKPPSGWTRTAPPWYAGVGPTLDRAIAEAVAKLKSDT